jgi:hypothetical protein
LNEGDVRLRRALTIGALLIGLLACGGGGWLGLRRAAIEPLVLPGALSVTTAWRGQTTLLVRYHMPGEPFGWRGQLSRQLEGEGWRGRSFTNMGARRPPFVTIFYVRERSIGPLSVVERAVFGGDPDSPNTAIVELTREIYLGETPLAGQRGDCLLCLGR